MKNLLIAIIISLFYSPMLVTASWQDDVGFTKLKLSLAMPFADGTDITISHIEAGTTYMPNTASSVFENINFTDKSGTNSGTSSHANTVGEYLYGKNSMASGVRNVDNWQADDWLINHVLQYDGSSIHQPAVETSDVQNHSWVGSLGSTTNDSLALRNYDYQIERDNFVAVVALNNGSSTPIPNLLAASYNTITVGRSDGNHSNGTTLINGNGRAKPDLVAPLGATSYATPIVASAAAILLDRANDHSNFHNAQNSEAIKAILMTGATKKEFINWQNSQTNPLDDTYGAGELNIYNSYNILNAGEQNASNNTLLSTKGWDFSQTNSNNNLYYFQLDEQTDEFTATLNWNLVIDQLFPTSDPTIADLGLEIWTVGDDSFNLQSMINYSNSSIDNVEHLYLTDLAAGTYALKVTSDTILQDYALAWQAVPEPTSLLLLLLTSSIALIRRRY